MTIGNCGLHDTTDHPELRAVMLLSLSKTTGDTVLAWIWTSFFDGALCRSKHETERFPSTNDMVSATTALTDLKYPPISTI
jgi:hypothetical protein